MSDNPLITKKPFRFPVMEITPKQPTASNKVFRIQFETNKTAWMYFIDDDVDFPGLLFMSDCGWEMRNPKVTVSRLLSGTVYRISMEVTAEVWGAFAIATVKDETLEKSYIIMSVDGEGLEDFDETDIPNDIVEDIAKKRRASQKNKANKSSSPIPKTFSEKSPAQQMTILCLRDNFKLFLIENTNPSVIGEADDMLKEFLFIKSKTEVNHSSDLKKAWVSTMEWFHKWSRVEAS